MYSELEGLIYFERFAWFVGYGTEYEYVFRGISEEDAEKYGFKLSYAVSVRDDSVGHVCSFEYTALDVVYDLLDELSPNTLTNYRESLLNLREYLIEREDEQSMFRVSARVRELDDEIEELESERRELVDLLDRSNN